MKKAICLLLSLIVITFSVIPALALEYKEYRASFELPQEYVEINAENASKYEEVLKYMGHTKNSFKKHLEKNNILLFAILKDNSRQVQLKANQTDFSKQVEDISLLENDALNDVGKKIIGTENANWNMVDIGGVIYYEIATNAKESDQTCSVQYVTIKNGYIYNLSLYGDAQNVSDAFLQEGVDLVSRLTVTSQKNKITADDGVTVIEILIISLLIIVAAVGVVLIIISFIKDAKNKQTDSDMGDLTIQRRRYK